MCGICGILGFHNTTDLKKMVNSMHHRGPNDYGVFEDVYLKFGMTRLSIIDTSRSGHQPMSNDASTIWIVYNGEMYNFREEKNLLQNKGYSFKSESDTEVVLSMYEYYGDDFLLRMRGMFALAIYDKRNGPGKEKILLARDHLGIKPLLYADTGSSFVFASEMKTMLASGLIERKFDPEALRLLLTMGSIPQPLTAVTGVKMLLPGHRLIIERGERRIEQYWQIKSNRVKICKEKSYEELVKEVRKKLEESVRLQLVGDVPIGAFLSGGIDSSLIVALMTKIGGKKLKTFSVGFEEEGAQIDETDDAERIAQYIGTDHTRVVVTGKDVREKIFHIAASLDQPSVDGVNSYFVSLAASKGVTVAVSGTGGDELFAGYPWFITMAKAWEMENEHPYLSAIKTTLGQFSQKKCFNIFIQGNTGKILDYLRMHGGFLSRYAHCYQIFNAHEIPKILSPSMKDHTRIGEERANDIVVMDDMQEFSPINRVTTLCLRGYTQNQLLRDIDAVSMAHSLEVRVPFLDPTLVNLVLSLPDETKLRKNILELKNCKNRNYRETGAKKILIDAGRDLLPEDIDLQQKRGFGMPFEAWLKGPLRDVMEDTLSESSINMRGFFDAEEVRRIKNDFLKGKNGWAGVWLLMIIELWCREVLDVPHSL
ncbi:asparagine synthase (glutamine-hydrolyzing) [Methanogenium sp. S4BF]|uniref:asparagine synthase (glutamine-hydrolyzing) n=1 Tax=Methanogenium sp. S4BF TaxID=1789226 RepID=UPI0024175F7F|nr:asparagine synthase (glutamine-hydrolyzing) [Methanogenium sp. S4BF]WFN34983.1 asparagine synthase (glutamine-hydrolyzing) [Methanogenium sp. S4BF]